MMVTNYLNDAAAAGDIQSTHRQIQDGDHPSVAWAQCPKGTKVVRARFLADRVYGSYIIDHSYTMVQWPDGSLHYLISPVWSDNYHVRRLGDLKRIIYKRVKAEGEFYPGLFDAINVFC